VVLRRATALLPWLVLVIAGATGYEVADAARWIDVEHGAPTGEKAVVLCAVVAMLVCGILALVNARTAVPRWEWIALPLVSIAFTIAHALSYDPYYLPTLRRSVDSTSGWKTLLVILFVATMISVALTLVDVRKGLPLVGVVTVACAFVALFERTGH
jgi:hypothetical protein